MKRLPRQRRQAGIALIEAMVAIVLLGVGLLGVIGLQTRSYAALSDTGMRAEATIAADKLLGVMGADLGNLAAYALAPDGTPGTRIQPWLADTRAHIPGAAVEVDVDPVAGTSRTRVVITISWARKANTAANQHVITSYLSNAT